MQTNTPLGTHGAIITPLILGFSALVAFLDTFAIVPILSPYAVACGATQAQAGWIVGLYSLANLIANFGSGPIIDRWGRRVPMALSLFCASVVIALYAVLSSPGWLMALRVLHGATGAVFVPALFALTGEYGRLNRTRAMGMISALIGLVAMIAPPVSGIVVKWHGEAVLFYGVSVLTALAGLSVLALSERVAHRARSEPMAWRSLWSMPLVVGSFWLTFGMTFAMGVMTVSLPLEMDSAGYDSAYRGRIWGLFALIAVLWMGLVRRREMFGGVRMRSALGVALLACGLLSYASVSLPMGAWVWALLAGAGFGLAFPAVHLLAYEGAPASLRGSALALLHAFYSLGYIVGPALAGWLTAHALSGWVGALLTFGWLGIAGFTLQRAHSSSV